MNRRNWIQKSAYGSASLAYSIYAPHVLWNQRKRYTGESEMLRLHWNENPYGPSPQAKLAAQKMLSEANHYPDDKIEELISAIAFKEGLTAKQVTITSGSTEVLCLLGQKIGLSNGEILMSEDSFPTIALFGERFGASIKTVPVTSEERLDLDQIKLSITAKTSLVFICNPNNPTSTDLPKKALSTFIKSVPERIIICVDEAYIQYSRDGEKGSLVNLINAHPNLIICRTFSKAYGLAGMRIGYALGNQELIDSLNWHHIGLGMSNSRVAVTAALASLKDQEHISMVVRQNAIGKKLVYDAFDKWGVKYADSKTNFIYARSRHFSSDVRTQLRKEQILITKWPSMKDHIRISIGRPEWMEKFVAAVEKYVV